MQQIKFGKLINTHGLKGEVKIASNSDFKQERLKKGAQLIINNENYIVKSWRVHKNHDLVFFEGFNSINDVEFLKGQEIFINVEDAGEDYLPNVLNKKVVDEDGNEIGIVKDILEYPMYDILEVVGDKKYLIPFIDAFVIDNNQEHIKVKLIEGLGE